MNYEIGDIIVNSNTVYLSILSNMEIRYASFILWDPDTGSTSEYKWYWLKAWDKGPVP